MKKKLLLVSMLLITQLSNAKPTKAKIEAVVLEVKAEINAVRLGILNATNKELVTAYKMFEDTHKKPLRELLDQGLKKVPTMMEDVQNHPNLSDDEAVQKVFYEYIDRAMRLKAIGLAKSMLNHYEKMLQDQNNSIQSCDKHMALLALLHVDEAVDYVKENADVFLSEKK